MGANNSLHRGPGEDARFPNISLTERFQKQRLQDGPEPVMRGNIEAFFAAPYDSFGQAILHQFPEHKLQASAADLEIFGKPRCELDDPVIQKRRPDFQRMRHAHAIDFGQNVVGQIVQLIHAKEAGQAGGGAITVPGAMAVSNMSGWDIPAVSEILLLASGKRTVPEEVGLDWIE